MQLNSLVGIIITVGILDKIKCCISEMYIYPIFGVNGVPKAINFITRIEYI